MTYYYVPSKLLKSSVYLVWYFSNLLHFLFALLYFNSAKFLMLILHFHCLILLVLYYFFSSIFFEIYWCIVPNIFYYLSIWAKGLLEIISLFCTDRGKVAYIISSQSPTSVGTYWVVENFVLFYAILDVATLVLVITMSWFISLSLVLSCFLVCMKKLLLLPCPHRHVESIIAKKL